MDGTNEIETTQGVERLSAVESALTKMMGGSFNVEDKLNMMNANFNVDDRLNSMLGVQEEYDPIERINDILS